MAGDLHLIDIDVRMHGSLRRFLAGGVASVQLAACEGVTVRWVAEQFRAEDEVWLSSIGQNIVPMSMPLTYDVTLDFFPILAGG